MLGKWRVNHYFKEKFQVHKNSSYFTITSHRGVILPETSMTIPPAEIQGGHLPVYSAINKSTCVFACLILCFEHQMHQNLISWRWEPCLLYILRKLSLAQKVLTTVEMNSIPRRSESSERVQRGDVKSVMLHGTWWNSMPKASALAYHKMKRKCERKQKLSPNDMQDTWHFFITANLVSLGCYRFYKV